MMNNDRIQKYSLKTSLAMANFYGSVDKVFPYSIKQINSKTDYYLGIKNVQLNLDLFLNYLDENGFHKHTIDKASFQGRGIDIDLKNPITGRIMTGSSSGTAINVFLGINDVGVGTDGGGSVLSPAAALNLIGFIHPMLGFPFIDLNEYTKQSTDEIIFSPSIGFIGRDLSLLKKISLIGLQIFNTSDVKSKISVLLDLDISNEDIKKIQAVEDVEITTKKIKDKYVAERQSLIHTLESFLSKHDILISKEGPIDFSGLGDTVFGHFDSRTKNIQNQSNKGFVRVVNMCNCMGLIVPTGELSTGYLIIGKPNDGILEKMFELADLIITNESNLTKNYFRNYKKYFENGIST